MKTDLPGKLILVLNSLNAKLFEANGLKITNKISELHQAASYNSNDLHDDKKAQHIFENKKASHKHDRHEFVKKVANHLKEIILSNIKHFKELILVAEPQAMGELNLILDSHVKNLITKQIAKDMNSHQLVDIERVAFN